MDFYPNEDQQLLLESLDEFLDNCGYDDDYFRKCYEEHRIPTEFQKALHEAGFATLGLPEEWGGPGADLLTLVLVAERLGERGFPCELMGTALSIDDMVTFGSDEQRKIVFDFLNETGGSCFCLGSTEPQAGSDSRGIASTATHRDGKVILNGHKSFITNALESPYMLFVCKEMDDEGTPVSTYFVPMDAPGVRIEPMHKIGCKMGSMCEVYIEDVELPESSLVGVRGNGFMQMAKNFEIERLLIAVNSMAYAECAFNDAARYANQREQFGKTIGSFQLIQEMIMEDYAKIQNMKNLCYQAAAIKDAGKDCRVAVGIAKYYCAREAFNVCDDAMQIMGGIGYTEDCRVSRMWADARMQRIGGGTDQIMVHTTSRQILKLYK